MKAELRITIFLTTTLRFQNSGKKIDSIASGYIIKGKNITGSTYENRKTPILDCITCSNSIELDRFITQLIKQLDKEK